MPNPGLHSILYLGPKEMPGPLTRDPCLVFSFPFGVLAFLWKMFTMVTVE